MRNSRKPRLMLEAASMWPSRYSSGSRTSMTAGGASDLGRRWRPAGPSSRTPCRPSATISLSVFMGLMLPLFPLRPLLYSQGFMARTATKGIILAGGSGTRLYPVTLALSKQLVPIYNKPMVYYPLSTLMLAGVRHVLVISTPQDQAAFRRLLGDGRHLGLTIEYAVQPSPDGLAQAFVIGQEFIGDGRVALALGDNVFYGHGFTDSIQRAAARARGATVFAYWVRDPQRCGVVEFDGGGHAVGLEEEAAKPRSPWAVAGLYVSGNRRVDIGGPLKPSVRGELDGADDSGAMTELARLTDGRAAGLGDFSVRQVNYSEMAPGAIKAFHLHARQTDVWFVPPSDRMLVVLLDVREGSRTEGARQRVVLGNGGSRLLLIPPGVAHGVRNLAEATGRIVYLTDLHFSPEPATW